MAASGGSPSNSPTVRIDPELTRLAVCVGIVPTYRLWALARELTRCAGGSGVVLLDDLRAALPTYGISGSDRQFSRWLVDGEHQLWTRQGERLFLRSIVRVAKALVSRALAAGHPEWVETNVPGTRDVYIRLGGTLADFKAQAYAAWLTHRECPTISRETQAQVWACSPQTIRNWEATLPAFEKRCNYAQCPNDQFHRPYAPDHAYTILATVDGQIEEQLTWQMPNTYIPYGFVQHPRKGQASKVRRAANQALRHQDNLTDRPADERLGGQRSRLYWQDGERLYRQVRKGKVTGGKYRFVGINRYGYGIWACTHSGLAGGNPNSRLPLRQEYAVYKRLGRRRTTGWQICAAMQYRRQKFDPHTAPECISRDDLPTQSRLPGFSEDLVEPVLLPFWFDVDRIRHKLRRGLPIEAIDDAERLWSAWYPYLVADLV